MGEPPGKDAQRSYARFLTGWKISSTGPASPPPDLGRFARYLRLKSSVMSESISVRFVRVTRRYWSEAGAWLSATFQQGQEVGETGSGSRHSYSKYLRLVMSRGFDLRGTSQSCPRWGARCVFVSPPTVSPSAVVRLLLGFCAQAAKGDRRTRCSTWVGRYALIKCRDRHAP